MNAPHDPPTGEKPPDADPPPEPATPFKWVIVTGIVVWALGAAMIVWSRLGSP